MDKIEIRVVCEAVGCGTTNRIYVPIVKYGNELHITCASCGAPIKLVRPKPAEVEPDSSGLGPLVVVNEESLATYPTELRESFRAYMNAMAHDPVIRSRIARINALGFKVVQDIGLVPITPPEALEQESVAELQTEPEPAQEVEARSEPEPLRGFWVIGRDPNIH